MASLEEVTAGIARAEPLPGLHMDLPEQTRPRLKQLAGGFTQVGTVRVGQGLADLLANSRISAACRWGLPPGAGSTFPCAGLHPPRGDTAARAACDEWPSALAP